MKEQKPSLEDLEKELIQLKKEKALLADELHDYKSAADGANDGLWGFDFERDHLFVTRPWCEMLGLKYDRIEYALATWENLLHPQDRNKALKSFWDFVEGKTKAYNIEFRLRHSNGHYIWIHSKATAIRDKTGKAIKISGSHTNISRRIHALDALALTEKKYKKLFENSLVGILRFTMDNGKVGECNRKVYQVLKREEKINTIADILEDKEVLKEILKTLKKEGKVENREIKFQHSEQGTIWILFSAIYQREEGYTQASLKDITELRKTMSELEKVNFELDNFVHHASHDLKSPLKSMLGLLTILEHEEHPDEREKIIQMIKGSVTRLENLVVDLLSISRNKRIDDPLQYINLMQEVNNSVSNFYSHSKKKVELITSIREYEPFVSDLTRVRIILNNLISNAIKYCKKEEGVHSWVKIEIEVKKGYCSLLIHDNGQGIPEDKLPKMFSMFYRATEKEEGSGLGLYIVKSVVEKLGGHIQLESKEGEYTLFKVKIPNQVNHLEAKKEKKTLTGANSN